MTAAGGNRPPSARRHLAVLAVLAGALVSVLAALVALWRQPLPEVPSRPPCAAVAALAPTQRAEVAGAYGCLP